MIGRGWQVFDAVVAPGDWNGDRKADLLARKPSGELLLYAGNGTGGFASAGRKIATGWQLLSEIITPATPATAVWTSSDANAPVSSTSTRAPAPAATSRAGSSAGGEVQHGALHRRPHRRPAGGPDRPRPAA